MINSNTLIKSKAICILGMHRSGTSTVSRAINLLGAYLGKDKDLMPPTEDNPEGYWERMDVYILQERILSHLKRTWDTNLPLPDHWHLSDEIRPFKDELRALICNNLLQHTVWAWKDPRTCILFPLWKNILDELGVELACVLTVRNPLDVANSLRKRDGIALDKSYGIWFNYNLAALQSLRGVSSIVISYDKFLDDSETELRRCAEALNIEWPTNDSELKKLLGSFVRKDLRHSKSGADELIKVPHPVRELYNLLSSVLDNTSPISCGLLDKADQLQREFINYAVFFRGDIEAYFDTVKLCRKLQEDVARKESDLAKLEHHFNNNCLQISALNQQLIERDNQAKELAAYIESLRLEMEQQRQQLMDNDVLLSHNDDSLIELKTSISEMSTALQAVYNSYSWKITKPARDCAALLLRLFKLSSFFVKLIPHLTTHNITLFLKYVRLFGWRTTITEAYKAVTTVPLKTESLVSAIAPATFSPVHEEVTLYDISISVVIPTKNAGEDFSQLLRMIRCQKGIREIEIVIVDSGSNDNTVATAMEFGAKIIEIPPSAFTHSYARNLGAENASSEYLFFTVQDALIPSETFFNEIYRIYTSNDVAALSCAEYPREDADLFYRACCWNHYHFLEVNNGDRIFSKPAAENFITLRKNGQLSDIANLIAKDIFMRYKYRDDYAEDLDLGIRLIKDNHRIAFLSSIKIIHSHNRPAYYYLKRGHVDQIFLTRKFADYPVTAAAADTLPQDILCTYAALCDLMNELDTLQLPCEIGKLFGLIYKRLSSTRAYSNTTPPPSLYVDNNFSAFIMKLHALYGNILPHSKECTLAQALVAFLPTLENFLGGSSKLVDDFIIEELKHALFKAFALLSGVNLANSFILDEKGTTRLFSELGINLREGV